FTVALAPGSTSSPLSLTVVHLHVWETNSKSSGELPVFLISYVCCWVVPLSILSKLKIVSSIDACAPAAGCSSCDLPVAGPPCWAGVFEPFMVQGLASQ